MSRKRGEESKNKAALKRLIDGIDYEYDERYGENWVTISKESRKKCRNCCLCVKNEAVLVHHVRYSRGGVMLLDDVVLGEDIFPVCKKCHSKLHRGGNWKTFKKRSENHNKESIIRELRIGFMMCSE